MKNFVISLLMFIPLLTAGCSIGGSNTETLTENVLVLTDIHFDPFTSCGESVTVSSQYCVNYLINESKPQNWVFMPSKSIQFGEETTNTFLESALQNLSQIIKQNQASKIFVTGDLLSHHFSSQFSQYVPLGTQEQQTSLAVNTITYVLYKISQLTPNTQIYYVFGNNDTDQSDYSFPTSDFMQKITSSIAKYMASAVAFSQTFSLGGYSLMPFNNNVDVIGLNFNPLTVENAGNPQDLAIAESQFVWLELQLANARKNNKHVMILQHEPFGMNAYNIIESVTPSYNLQLQLQQKYLAVYKKYADIINNYYYGHYHMETIQIAGGIFAFSTLGLSIDYYNNPGFKILKLDQNGKLQNYLTYYSDYANSNDLIWKQLYQLNSAYKINSTGYVIFFESQLQAGANEAWLTYVRNYSGQNLTAPVNQIPILLPRNWQYYYCTITKLDPTSYNYCLTDSLGLNYPLSPY